MVQVKGEAKALVRALKRRAGSRRNRGTGLTNVTLPIVMFALSLLFATRGAIAEEWVDMHPIPSGHLRIATFNLEVFNFRNTHPQHTGTPYGPRTSAQLDVLAARIIGFGAAIVSLQEMNALPALDDLRDRMNGGPGASGPWQVLTEIGQQNAILYDDTRVDLVSSAFTFFTFDLGVYPAEAFYRSPVTAVFTPEAQPGWPFYVVGVHGSWQGYVTREQQGVWLGRYTAALIDDPSTPDRLVLAGDMNGNPIAGDVPHDGLVATGHLAYLPKSNGGSTAIGGATIDHLYASSSLLALEPMLSTTVIRNDPYGETPAEFRACCSDHFAVYVDLPVVTAVPTSGARGILVLLACASLVAAETIRRKLARAP